MARRAPGAGALLRMDTTLFASEQLEQLARHAALLAIGIIQRRTEQGRGLEGRFKPYTKGYAALRKAAGRRVDPPNLTLSGAMLNGLQVVRSGPSFAIVGFVGAAPATRFKKSSRWVERRVGGITRRRRLTRSVSKSSSKVVANAVKAAANHDRRPFFGLTPDEQAELHRELGKFASKLLREKPRQ